MISKENSDCIQTKERQLKIIAVFMKLIQFNIFETDFLCSMGMRTFKFEK